MPEVGDTAGVQVSTWRGHGAASGPAVRPEEYRNSYVLRNSIPYEIANGAVRGAVSSSGTFDMGRVLWFKHELADGPMDELRMAYAEGVGLVAVDRRLLGLGP